MIENLPSPEDKATCHEPNGWLPTGFADSIRDIMNRYVSEEVRRRNGLTPQLTSQSIPDQAQSSNSDSDSSD